MRHRDEARSAAEILAHIEKYGVAKKDAAPLQQRREGPHKAAAPSRGRRVRATLDLHGLRSDEAAVKLRAAVDRCKATGAAELLVIHGYGLHSDPSEGPVLKKLVRDMLDNELVGNYRDYRAASLRDGGDGATLVLLR